MNSSAEQRTVLQRTQTVTHILDESARVLGTNDRIGIDPIVGVLPLSGDIAAALLSLYIVLKAARYRVPLRTLALMEFNIAVDIVSGSIPVLERRLTPSGKPIFETLSFSKHRSIMIIDILCANIWDS
ncbi:DUF4112 domain-containing protein [Halocatena marina]|uniref:DUF4112 domain-containing protein n=1 Tax=Halocatena marina TaxID=2934937 RepID=UPI00200C3C00|nr:DUF4112 domain-containing protein [Halocatena marina]